MIDIQLIRNNPELVKENMRRSFKKTKFILSMKQRNWIYKTAGQYKEPTIFAAKETL